jgi:hypothetical protein
VALEDAGSHLLKVQVELLEIIYELAERYGVGVQAVYQITPEISINGSSSNIEPALICLDVCNALNLLSIEERAGRVQHSQAGSGDYRTKVICFTRLGAEFMHATH